MDIAKYKYLTIEECNGVTILNKYHDHGGRIYIPKEINRIRAEAFPLSLSSNDIYYEGTLEDWMNITFDTFLSNPLEYCENLHLKDDSGEYYLLTVLVVPKSITKIKEYAFTGCSSIEKIILHGGVDCVEHYAFNDCRNLKSIVIYGNDTTDGKCADIVDNSIVLGGGCFAGHTAPTSLHLYKTLSTRYSSPFSHRTLEGNVFKIFLYRNSYIVANGFFDNLLSVFTTNQIEIYALEGLCEFDMSSITNDISRVSKIFYSGTPEEWSRLTKLQNLPVIFNCTKEAIDVYNNI